MRFFSAALMTAMLLLSACSSSHRPVYSGHEENTEGVPGFVNGKKVSPYVKLGQSYTVDDETYVPRYQPDYVEEGEASWYGPGFHGGATANGESFDKHEMTAAHRTLPLPSIVRVTLLSSGKSAYVRINDRGPFAKGRIIDLSHAAADAIGLTRLGTARVRVEYMPRESQRFADLLAEGRDPKSIDLAGEVIGRESAVQVASNNLGKSGNSTNNWLNHLNPVSEANASVPKSPPAEPAAPPAKELPPVADQPSASADLPPDDSPFAVLDRNAVRDEPIAVADTAPAGYAASKTDPPATLTTAALPPPAAPPAARVQAPTTTAPPAAPAVTPVATNASSLQLGAFVQQANAERMQKMYSKYGTITVLRKQASNGMTMFFVRMGPFASADQSTEMLARLHAMGVEARTVKE